jgi:Zn-dependent peptidase ImmA (M78 family)
MGLRIEAIVKPELLLWARENAGFSLDLAAKRAKIREEKLADWESGIQKPTINQLRKLSDVYKIPLAAFYLSEAPRKVRLPQDFRRLHNGIKTALSPNLMLEIRKAENRRLIALDIFDILDESYPILSLSASPSSDAESLALTIRDMLKVTVDEQLEWKSYPLAFNKWKIALENLGVLVFQAVGVDTKEMRGFSISDTPLPVIVANVKDSYSGRIFTIMHELVHILLKRGGICDLEEFEQSIPELRSIEVFSNRIAGEILVPSQIFLKERIIADKVEVKLWNDNEISSLARRYNVSREVILRRLLALGKINNEFYQKKREELLSTYVKSAQAGKVIVPPYIKALSSMGHLYIRLVLSSYNQNRITSSDVSDFLGVKIKHIEKIEKELQRSYAISGTTE